MTLSRTAPRLLPAILVALAPTLAPAQAPLEAAVETWRAVQGRWVAPGHDCTSPEGVWTLLARRIEGPGRALSLRGIGGSAQFLRLDMTDGAGRRVGGTLAVDGAGGARLTVPGLSVGLRRCAAPLPQVPDAPAAPLTLDDAPRLPPATTPPEDTKEAATIEPALGAIAGQWTQPGGDCAAPGWELGETTIRTPEGRFAIAGELARDGRLGINALRESDGAPTTFTATQGAGAIEMTVGIGREPARRVRLERC
ncbi:hypothetical protein E2L08_16095 [Palleronia sediminis]|uniref:Uncharacterized protein n=1 Tax=Palleronia sediminis TaxID=2547833 RepID=A0A4R5ZTD6_9RHOB|nr:hypothetical protein [Palleronia sediminis]TDL74231.1 hypothetical protein E2L08_16095 [Palleronia sediminis]